MICTYTGTKYRPDRSREMSPEKRESLTCGKDVEQFLNRTADTTVPPVITAYENRIRKLEDEKVVLAEKIAFAARLNYVRNEAFGTANLARPFNALSHCGQGKSSLVDPGVQTSNHEDTVDHLFDTLH